MAIGKDIKLNSQLLNPQPSRFVATPPEPTRAQVVNGGYQSSIRSKGWKFTLTFGDKKYADDETLADMRNRLSALGSTALLTWTDVSNTVQNKTVQVDVQIPHIIEVAGLAGQFSIELVEAP